MSKYIDGYVFPIAREHQKKYQKAAKAIAEIWKEHGAIAYCEYVQEEAKLEGTRSFPNLLSSKEDEVIIFGWLSFESKEARDLAHEKVSTDERMPALVAPLTDSSKLIFDVSQMVFGGFEKLV